MPHTVLPLCGVSVACFCNLCKIATCKSQFVCARVNGNTAPSPRSTLPLPFHSMLPAGNWQPIPQRRSRLATRGQQHVLTFKSKCIKFPCQVLKSETQVHSMPLACVICLPAKRMNMERNSAGWDDARMWRM